MKSRFGTSDFWVPFGFYGDCSQYFELPRPDDIYDYEKYKNPHWIFDKKIEDNIKIEDKQNNNLSNKFIL